MKTLFDKLSFSLFPQNSRLILRTGFFLLLAALILCSHAGYGYCAPSVSKLEQELAKEQQRAAQRKASLKKLTTEERKINSELAKSEARILQIESGIQAQQQKLMELAKDDEQERKQYEVLLEEQKATEQAQKEALQLLWEIVLKRKTVGPDDMTDWAKTDRDYTWSNELYSSLEQYRTTLDRQEAELAAILGRREKLSTEIQRKLDAVNEEKSNLLQARIDYEQRLSALRKELTSTEDELTKIMSLIDNLNLQISKASEGDIKKLKGKLPSPVDGKLKKKYAPGATPPVRGFGFEAEAGADVIAVAPGKVVHNNVLRGFGTVVILQHNDEYYTLYAFMDKSPHKVGANVSARQKIGTVGYYPDVSGSGLYFELRLKQKAINPEQWFASLKK